MFLLQISFDYYSRLNLVVYLIKSLYLRSSVREK